MGILDKLSITPFLDENTLKPAGPPFVAQFNPETLELKHQVKLNTGQMAQLGTKTNKQVGIEPQEYNFEFILDGTGASGKALNVDKEVKTFHTATGFSGSSHRNHFLLLRWGQFVLRCVLKEYSINYKLFRPDGTALRAAISATFTEFSPDALQNRKANLSSPDVSHSHVVTGKTHLGAVSFEHYEATQYCTALAEYNRLDTLRKLAPGQALLIPPLTSLPPLPPRGDA